MKILFEDIYVSTKNRTEVVDVTADIEENIRRSSIMNGVCVVHTVHSTAAVIVNEHEAGLIKDIVKKVQQDFPKGRDGSMIRWITMRMHTSRHLTLDQQDYFQLEKADLLGVRGKTFFFLNWMDPEPEKSW